MTRAEWRANAALGVALAVCFIGGLLMLWAWVASHVNDLQGQCDDAWRAYSVEGAPQPTILSEEWCMDYLFDGDPETAP